MFPGVDGFHWTVDHVLFLSIFFTVVLILFATVLRAVLRTTHELHSEEAPDFCWKSDFAELPEAERHCRHEMAGRVESRVCDNAFDCRTCKNYSKFASLPGKPPAQSLAVDYSPERFYHRGHTWVELQKDGDATIGLDEFAQHLIGEPDFITMPAIGTELHANAPAWSIHKHGKEIPVRAPLDGKVVEVGDGQTGWYLRIRPRDDVNQPATLRHLLRGAEVEGWLSHELERLQHQLKAPDAVPTLADGGVLMPDLMDAIPNADWDAVLADTFMEV